jgi:hypothetical protein
LADYYLKAADEAVMNAALVDAGLAYLDEDALVPAPGVSLDVIGPISRVIGYDDEGEPIVQEYPEWHVNVRCGGLSEEQEAALAGLVIVPPETPFRVWA